MEALKRGLKPCGECASTLTASASGLCVECDPETRYAYRSGQLQALVESYLAGFIRNKKALKGEYEALQKRWNGTRRKPVANDRPGADGAPGHKEEKRT